MIKALFTLVETLVDIIAVVLKNTLPSWVLKDYGSTRLNETLIIGVSSSKSLLSYSSMNNIILLIVIINDNEVQEPMWLYPIHCDSPIG